VRLRKQTLLRLAGAAGLFALTGLSAAPACAQSAGRITFAGAITAPSFEITAAPERGVAATSRSAHVSGVSGPDVTVSFISPPGGSPPASVALMPVGSDQPGQRDVSAAVTASLFDHTGNREARDANGRYRLDPRGAVMNLAAVKSASSAGHPFVVVVSYD
jgi:hypothetical protein